MVVEVVAAGGEDKKPTEGKGEPWRVPPALEGLSPLELHIAAEIDARQNGTEVDRTGVVAELAEFFRKKGLHQVRIDRWTWSPAPTTADFYIEVGTVYGEVRVRWYNLPGQTATGAIDIRTAKHLANGKKRISTVLKQSQGLTYVRGEGWK